MKTWTSLDSFGAVLFISNLYSYLEKNHSGDGTGGLTWYHGACKKKFPSRWSDLDMEETGFERLVKDPSFLGFYMMSHSSEIGRRVGVRNSSLCASNH